MSRNDSRDEDACGGIIVLGKGYRLYGSEKCMTCPDTKCSPLGIRNPKIEDNDVSKSISVRIWSIVGIVLYPGTIAIAVRAVFLQSLAELLLAIGTAAVCFIAAHISQRAMKVKHTLLTIRHRKIGRINIIAN